MDSDCRQLEGFRPLKVSQQLLGHSLCQLAARVNPTCAERSFPVGAASFDGATPEDVASRRIHEAQGYLDEVVVLSRCP